MSPLHPYRAVDVPVEGGALHVGVWGDGPDVVLAAHGITGNHRTFAPLAAALDGPVTLAAPDLRGRGRSAAVTGGYGMERHADDLVALLDALGVERAVVVGHSMGGFVAVVTADRHPDRVRGLVLVDGGLPLDLGPLADLPVEDAVRAVIGPSLDRLDTTFASEDDYLAFWQRHPAFAGAWDEQVASVFRHDLVGEPPALRSSVLKAAVLEDSASQLRPGAMADAVARLRMPVVALQAGSGMLGARPGLYPPGAMAGWQDRLPQLEVRPVPEANHYTVLLSPAGAAEVARAVVTVMGG